MTPGVPFSSACETKAAFIAGTSTRDRTIANPIKWVKLTFIPAVRMSWSLSAPRFTSSNRAGTVRTDVAVGTVRLASMLLTIRAAAPRSGVAFNTGNCVGSGVFAAFDSTTSVVTAVGM